jgi:hypothetical protein
MVFWYIMAVQNTKTPDKNGGLVHYGSSKCTKTPFLAGIAAGNAGCFKKSFTIVIQMLLFGEGYEYVYT